MLLFQRGPKGQVGLRGLAGLPGPFGTPASFCLSYCGEIVSTKMFESSLVSSINFPFLAKIPQKDEFYETMDEISINNEEFEK